MSVPDRFQRRAALTLAFVVPLALYGATLAPTVTLEDSGELAAAVYTLGVPHSPGYPLFTLLGKAFTVLPLGDVATRLNLMSACLSALAAMLLAWATARVLEQTDGALATGPGLRWGAALSAGLWFATAFETWEQSIITEVYALNAAIFAGMLLLIASGLRGKEAGRGFVPGCFLAGLALTAHVTSAILIPMLGLHLLLDGGLPRTARRWLAGAAAFAAGLAPYLYLPLASAREPAMDWGDPETPARLWRTVVLGHHRLRQWPTPGELLERIAAWGRLVSEQWPPLFLSLALVGMIVLYRRRPRLSAQVAVWLVLCGPLVALATNIDVTLPDARVAAENLAQVSVHYIPGYAVIALLMGVGACAAADFVLARGTRRTGWAAAALVVLPLAVAVPTCRAVGMRGYHLADDYAANVFAVAEPDSIVLADWDSFYFPLVYAQIVGGQRPDLTLLDQHLLRRSWYVEQWLARRPLTGGPARAEAEAFLEAVRPFERGRPHDAPEIERRYEAMLRALVARNVEAGRSVYFVYRPPADLTGGRPLESVLVARRLGPPSPEPAPVPQASLRFRGVGQGPPAAGRWREVFAEYYGELAWERAVRLERAADFAGALGLYRRAGRLLPDGARRSEVRSHVARLERQLAP